MGPGLDPAPETEEEGIGTVANVVFPTAIEEIDGVHYVFYDMADARIGVARPDRDEEAGRGEEQGQPA